MLEVEFLLGTVEGRGKCDGDEMKIYRKQKRGRERRSKSNEARESGDLKGGLGDLRRVQLQNVRKRR